MPRPLFRSRPVALTAALLAIALVACSESDDTPAGNTTATGNSSAQTRPDVPPAIAANTREVLVVSNNWDGTADFVEAGSYKRLLRLNIIPDKAERLREIQSSPDRYGFYLAIQQLIGEGNDQYVDDSYTSPDGKFLYVSRPSFADVVAFDLATRNIVWRTPMEGYRSDHMALSPDGRQLAVSDSTANKVQIIDVRDGKVLGAFESGDQPHENTYSADGKRIFHASIGTVYTPLDQVIFDKTKGKRYFQVVDAATNTVIKRVDIAQKLREAGYPDFSSAVRPMAISPDENRFYLQLSFFHGFVEYDLAQDRIVRVVPLPKVTTEPRENYQLDSAHHGLAITPDGKTLCAAGTMDGYAALVDTASTEHRLVQVGPKPYWSTTSSDGTLCYVSISEEDAVAVIDYRTAQLIGKFPVGDHPQRMRTGRLAKTAVREETALLNMSAR